MWNGWSCTSLYIFGCRFTVLRGKSGACGNPVSLGVRSAMLEEGAGGGGGGHVAQGLYDKPPQYLPAVWTVPELTTCTRHQNTFKRHASSVTPKQACPDVFKRLWRAGQLEANSVLHPSDCVCVCVCVCVCARALSVCSLSLD